jgi:hypothetical protein
MLHLAKNLVLFHARFARSGRLVFDRIYVTPGVLRELPQPLTVFARLLHHFPHDFLVSPLNLGELALELGVDARLLLSHAASFGPDAATLFLFAAALFRRVAILCFLVLGIFHSVSFRPCDRLPACVLLRAFARVPLDTASPLNSMHPLATLAFPKLEADCEILLRQHDEASRRLLANAVAALRRIESGTYGFCETCGDRIDDQRLLARLSTRHCAACAKPARPNARDA